MSVQGSTGFVVETSALTKRFGDRVAVDNVELRVPRGSAFGYLGPNGAGKTTLLRALAGICSYTGRIRLAGQERLTLSARESARLVALVPQQPIVPGEMTVVEYVLLGRTPHLAYLAQEGAADATVAAEALARLELGRLTRRRLGSLSGGELQRTLIGRALAQQAPILLLDEPTTSLDVGHQQEVLELVDQLRQESELTVVATMHDLTLAAQYGDRTILLDGGRIVADGTPSTVLTEAVVRSLYGAEVRLVHEAGELVGIVPLRRREVT
jgi:iron complex transport system ATP-binding protein